MINRVFAVYDSKALAYLQPFFSESVGSAVRAFGDAANESGSPLSKHPGDYQLYEIGTFDNLTGMLTAIVPMKLLGCALDFVTVKPSLAAVPQKLNWKDGEFDKEVTNAKMEANYVQ